MDIPLLFEQDYASWFDETWLVYVRRDTQLDRLMNRDQLSKESAETRLASQWPLEEKKDLASPCSRQQWQSGSTSNTSTFST